MGPVYPAGPIFCKRSRQLTPRARAGIFLRMARTNIYYFLIDKLDHKKAEVMKKSLKTVTDIKRISINPTQRLIEIESSADIEPQVQLACNVAGTIFRRRVKEKEF
jgi:hypothetical protein